MENKTKKQNTRIYNFTTKKLVQEIKSENMKILFLKKKQRFQSNNLNTILVNFVNVTERKIIM